eukprot:1737210-Rhodomonas_salina.1
MPVPDIAQRAKSHGHVTDHVPLREHRTLPQYRTWRIAYASTGLRTGSTTHSFHVPFAALRSEGT